MKGANLFGLISSLIFMALILLVGNIFALAGQAHAPRPTPATTPAPATPTPPPGGLN